MSIQNFDKAAMIIPGHSATDEPQPYAQTYINAEQRSYFFYFVRLAENLAKDQHAAADFKEQWLSLPKYSLNKKNLVSVLFGVTEAWKQHGTRAFGEDFPDWMHENFQIWEDYFLNLREPAKAGHIIDVLQSCKAIDVEPSQALWRNLEDNTLRKEDDFSPSFTAQYMEAAEYFQRLPSQEVLDVLDRRALNLVYNFHSSNITKYMNGNAGLGRIPPQQGLDAIEKRIANTIDYFTNSEVITGLWTGAMYEALSQGKRSLSQETQILFRHRLPQRIEKLSGRHWRQMHHAALWFGYENPTDITLSEVSKPRDVWEGSFRHECREAFKRGGLRSHSRIIPLIKHECIFSCLTPNSTIVHIETDDADSFNWKPDGEKVFNGHTISMMRLSERLQPDSVFLRMEHDTYKQFEKQKSLEQRIQGIRAVMFEASRHKPGTYIITPDRASSSHARYGLRAI